MAWNPSPEVAMVRDAARKLNADKAVLIFTTKGNKLGAISYGETKALCGDAKRLSDRLYDVAFGWCADEAFGK